ncbi:hypothetical protein Tco_0491323 [Tanacetum coccineum]
MYTTSDAECAGLEIIPRAMSMQARGAIRIIGMSFGSHALEIWSHNRSYICTNVTCLSVTDTVMSSDSASSEEPDSPEAALASPDYVLGLEEPEQAPLSPDYVPGPEYPEYLAPSNEEATLHDLDLEEDPEEDSKNGPVDYPADGGDGDDDESR